MNFASRTGFAIVVSAIWLQSTLTAAQQPPASPPPASSAAPPVAAPPVAAEPAPASVAPPAAQPAAPSVDPGLEARLQDWTRQLLMLESRAQEIELERSRVRTLGLRIGKGISWGMFGMLALNAFGFFATAGEVEEAIDDGRTDKAYDVDGDKDVDRDDEQRARRISRALIITSLIPLGLGIFTTVLERKRRRKIASLNAELDDITRQRRSVLSRLSQDVSVSGTQATLGMRLTF